MSNSTRSDNIIFGNVYDFVGRWISLILSLRSSRNTNKDWRLLERLSSEEFAAYSQHGMGNSKVVSFSVNRVTQPLAQQNRYIYNIVSECVEQHCIGQQLTLPGFYAFLKNMMKIEKTHADVFEEEQRLKVACNDLITGYWEKVKPSLYDATHGVSDNMTADASAVQGIEQLLEEVPDSGKANDLDPRPPFKKTIQADLRQTLGSRPTPTPTL